MKVRNGGAVVGQIVTIRLDGADQEIKQDDYLRTEAGKIYKCVRVRRVQRGKTAGRYELRGLVSAEVPDGARLHIVEWHREEGGHRVCRARGTVAHVAA